MAMNSISDSAPKQDVNQRLPIRSYFRIADNLLRQARIYREEGNVLELYILLLRFSSLITDTIPFHNDYKRTPDAQRLLLRKRLFEAVNELETLKPAAQLEWTKAKSSAERLPPKVSTCCLNPTPGIESLISQNDTSIKYNPVQEQARWQSSVTWSTSRPRDETISRHSYFSLQPPRSKSEALEYIPKRVSYPSHIDFSHVEIPSLDQAPHPEPAVEKLQESYSSQFDLVNQLAPPPVPVPVQRVPSLEPVADPRPGPPALSDEQGPKHLHVSTRMMEEFLGLARRNTEKNLETCGVLAGILEKGLFSITTLIIPKQEATSDSCQTVNEEELFEVQDKRNLFQLGWIHTHPTQTCFMSSIDLHTHYSYQVMLREAIAIVMAPTDEERSFGIFRLSEPAGMKTIQQCDQRGFHPHDEPENGASIYDHCSHVYMNPNLKFDIVDLRYI